MGAVGPGGGTTAGGNGDMAGDGDCGGGAPKPAIAGKGVATAIGGWLGGNSKRGRAVAGMAEAGDGGCMGAVAAGGSGAEVGGGALNGANGTSCTRPVPSGESGAVGGGTWNGANGTSCTRQAPGGAMLGVVAGGTGNSGKAKSPPMAAAASAATADGIENVSPHNGHWQGSPACDGSPSNKWPCGQ